MEGAYNVALTKVVIPEDVDRRFAFFLLNSDAFQRPLLEIERAAQDGFNKEDLAEIRLPLAPLAEQRRIAGKMELLLGKVSSSQQRLSRVPGLLKRFRQSVLAAACSGKLTADWREENEDIETAIELLARLQVERRTTWSLSHPNRRYQEPEGLEEDDLAAIPDSWLWTIFDHCLLARIQADREKGNAPTKTTTRKRAITQK
jgi:type I restriction enzyme, S subunit